MKGYKHIDKFKVLAEKVSEILNTGNKEELMEHLRALLDYNERNREAIISECKEIDGMEEV